MKSILFTSDSRLKITELVVKIIYSMRKYPRDVKIKI